MIWMKKRLIKKTMTLAMLFIFTFSCAVTPICVNAKTISKTVTYKLSNKNCYLGLSAFGMHPTTSNWSSSNASIASVSSSGDSDGGHKVIFKKKGKVTISCKIKTTKGNWKKGDIHKWVLTIK